MPISAAGNKSAAPPDPGLANARSWRTRGFTLIELLVVLALVAMASAGVTLALRDSNESLVERDAQRLAAVLESARAQARASDSRVLWMPRDEGFQLLGLPRSSAPQAWLSAQTRVLDGRTMVLGPEPLIGPQSVVLSSRANPAVQWWVRTDGLRPFMVERGRSGARP